MGQTTLSENRTASNFECPKCKIGRMDKVSGEGDAEYSDTFSCGKCGHNATIPSMMIIGSQILSGVFGGVFSIFLFIDQLSALMTAFQFNLSEGIVQRLLLLSVSAVFVAGFLYTLLRAVRGYMLRKAYCHSL